ncbi:cytokine receptor-like factor 2 [Trichechus manatus latirostris]|uniref:Cytokine receptor-like factor 2 n=1 Tax=Trichechus manatus latirostris TaxID=127582 RepID=A0A2Y9E2N7_TRIMA|nr:cytokine receptor-like factor 2 [Trichechus manatus latirostris]
MRRFFPSWAAAALLLLGDLVALEESEPDPEEAVQLQFINFNFDTVWVTWNASQYPGTNLTFSYKFRGGAARSKCQNYTLDQGYASGCVLEVEPDEDGARDVILELSLCNKTSALLKRSVWISDYLKPKSPEDLNFLWQQEAVTVTCSNLSYKGLLYEVQYRSDFDFKWESTEQKTCSITVENLDADKCYYFRARVKTMESRYGSETYPSDWSEVTHWQGGERKDACQQEETHFPQFVLISSLVALLTVCVLLLLLWERHRVKNFLIPSVPDPKFTFPGLFEDHRGNFQEWIKFTENMAYVNKVENEEEECALEEMLVAQLVKAEVEAPTTGLLCPQTEVEEALGPGQHPHQPPQHSEVVTLGGFSFVMSDNSYVML